jgi:hypothetical protein
MPNTVVVRAALAAALLFVSAPRAGAQMFELVGTRAQGMAGAFVAVADDATATWWNPAGIGTGALIFSAVFEKGLLEEPDGVPEPGPGWRGSSTGFAMAYPAAGLSYYRLRISEIAPTTSTAGSQLVRQEDGATGVVLRSFSVSQYGATIVQSAGGALVIGSTLKLMRGGVANRLDSGASAAIDRAEDLDVEADTELDLDIGAIASMGRARIGLSVKNVRQPAFGDDNNRIKLMRQARVGAAVSAGSTGAAIASFVAAVDADLTKTTTAIGEVRHVAAGAEALFFERRIGIRGGLSANTVGDVQTATSVGLSVGTASGLHLDGALTAGSDQSRTGWRLGFRVTF